MIADWELVIKSYFMANPKTVNGGYIALVKLELTVFGLFSSLLIKYEKTQLTRVKPNIIISHRPL